MSITQKHNTKEEESISGAVLISTLRISARRNPLKLDFQDFWKVSEFLQSEHTQHTEDRVSRAACWFGLVLQKCTALLCLQLKGSMLFLHAIIACSVSAGRPLGGANTSTTGGHPVTRPRWHWLNKAFTVSPSHQPWGPLVKPKKKLLLCCLATTGKKPERGRVSTEKDRLRQHFLCSFS